MVNITRYLRYILAILGIFISTLRFQLPYLCGHSRSLSVYGQIGVNDYIVRLTNKQVNFAFSKGTRILVFLFIGMVYISITHEILKRKS